MCCQMLRIRIISPTFAAMKYILTGINPLTDRREAISYPMEIADAVRQLVRIKRDGSVYKRVTLQRTRLDDQQLLLYF